MKKKNPLVSIICTCFNHADSVGIALDSVLNQNYENIELFIVDDSSTDNSVDTIKRWIAKHNFGSLFINKNNLGLTKSFNNAFKHTKGDYLIDLSADDELLPHCIASQISAFSAHQSDNIGIVYGNAFVVDKISNQSYVYFDKFSQEKKTLTPKDGYIYKELIDHSNTICSVSSMINCKIFKALNGYDERLIYEDYDFWLRVARKYHILYIDEILVKRMKLKNSLGHFNYLCINKNNYNFKYSTYLVLKKIIKMNKSEDENKASLRKLLMELKINIKIMNISLAIKYIPLFFVIVKKLVIK